MPEKTITNFQTGIVAVVLIMLIVCKDLIKKTIDRFFKKTVDAEYVTTDQCEKHRIDIKEQTDYKIEATRGETHRMLNEINKNIEFSNNHLETLNESVLLGVMNNDSLTEDQKQKTVIDLSKRKR